MNAFLSRRNLKEEIVVVVVVCGARKDETLNMIKSVLLFNTDNHPLRFVIITEESLYVNFSEKVRMFDSSYSTRQLHKGSFQLDDWLGLTGNTFKYDLLPLTFPKKNENEWKTLFKPCAAQRLFLPVSPIRFG